MWEGGGPLTGIYVTGVFVFVEGGGGRGGWGRVVGMGLGQVNR